MGNNYVIFYRGFIFSEKPSTTEITSVYWHTYDIKISNTFTFCI